MKLQIILTVLTSFTFCIQSFNAATSQIVNAGVFNCVLLVDASVKCWGQNLNGQLGYGDQNDRGDQSGEMGDSLAAVDLGTGVVAVQITAGLFSTCARLSDASVKCWGGNRRGQLGYGVDADRGDEPGEMGDALPSIDLGAGRTAVEISMGSEHCCAVLDDASIKCWGENQDGQLGYGDVQVRGDQPGEMGDSLAAVDLGTSRTAVHVSAGIDFVSPHTCAVLDNGSVKCWGGNTDGQLGYGDTLDRGDQPGEMGDALPTIDLGVGRTAIQVSAGSKFTCAVLDDASVKCWGQNNVGQLGYGDKLNRGDGSGEMGDALPTVDLGAGRKAVQISAGLEHTCVLLDDASIKCWGENQDGQLGYGDKNNRGDGPGEMGDNLPAVDLGTSRTAVGVSAGGDGDEFRFHTCAVLDDASVKCWSSNFDGQLGYGDTIVRGDQAGEMGDALPVVDLGSGITAFPTGRPSLAPSSSPVTPFPTRLPSSAPSSSPVTPFPTHLPSSAPSSSPVTPFPTRLPSSAPSSSPVTPFPTRLPSSAPSESPVTPLPTRLPSFAPSGSPTTPFPTRLPSFSPSLSPTPHPSIFPSNSPSQAPSVRPTLHPSFAPSQAPSAIPTTDPSIAPTQPPTSSPTEFPSIAPSIVPSIAPSSSPTIRSSTAPSRAPSASPTLRPSLAPTQAPSQNPTGDPSISPTRAPTLNPTRFPSIAPSAAPSSSPTTHPTISPSRAPSEEPLLTAVPTINPLMGSTSVPTGSMPSTFPTPYPSAFPTRRRKRKGNPTVFPSTYPTKFPDIRQRATQALNLPVPYLTYDGENIDFDAVRAEVCGRRKGFHDAIATCQSLSMDLCSIDSYLSEVGAGIAICGVRDYVWLRNARATHRIVGPSFNLVISTCPASYQGVRYSYRENTVRCSHSSAKSFFSCCNKNV